MDSIKSQSKNLSSVSRKEVALAFHEDATNIALTIIRAETLNEANTALRKLNLITNLAINDPQLEKFKDSASRIMEASSNIKITRDNMILYTILLLQFLETIDLICEEECK